MKRFIKEYASELGFTAAFAVVAAIMYITPVHCLFKLVTGIPCMTCGMTRACLHALRLDFSGAFYYHPLWPAVPPLFLALFFRKKLPQRVLVVFVAAVLAAFALTYIARLLFITDSLIYLKRN